MLNFGLHNSSFIQLYICTDVLESISKENFNRQPQTIILHVNFSVHNLNSKDAKQNVENNTQNTGMNWYSTRWKSWGKEHLYYKIVKIWIGANNENKEDVKLEHDTKFSRTKAKAGCGNINLLKLEFTHYIGNPTLFFLFLNIFNCLYYW